ncbi:MDR family MFS transporter [Lysinibacillus sp. 54212]|uniref:MDR family MFS transporter n=1 Tax=Lysinibacillus sp. 54212 TaxID=3119829 RepID=UPI002FCCB41E
MPKRVWFLIVGMFFNTVGSSFLWPLNSIYIHNHLGKTLTIAGIVLMLNSLAGVIGNLLGGFLFDRIGGYKTILFGVTANLSILGMLTIWHDFTQYIVFLTLLGFTSGIIFPSMYALIGSTWEEGGRRAFNTMFLTNNVGVAIGPALAGIIADINFEYVFVTNFATYSIFFGIVIATYKRFDRVGIAPKNVIAESAGIHAKTPMYAILILSISLVLCWLSYTQWSATISSYTQELGMSLSQYSVLWTINGLLIVAVQPIIRPLVLYWEDKLKNQLVLGLLLMSASFVLVYFAGDFKMFVAAMVVLTLGEVFFSPVIPAIANKLAPQGRQGFYQGIVNSATTLGRMIGPLLGGVVVDIYGMGVLALMLTVVLVVAIIPCLLYDRPLKRA